MSRMSIERLKPADLGAHVGKVFGVSSWILVDQQRINEFARCTNDHQWIHVDVERAIRDSPFGATVAHGFLTLALLAPTIFEVMLSRVQNRSQGGPHPSNRSEPSIASKEKGARRNDMEAACKRC